jgi:outer membrane protein X
MKKIISLVLITLAVANGYSQEKGKFRVGLDLGFVPTGGGGGGMFSIEPKFNITDNMNVGLRLGGAGIARDIQSNSGQSTTAKISANGSIIGTYDYYFHKSGSAFAPYIGAGFGYYEIANVEFDDSNVNQSTTLNPDSSGEIGGLVRAGFEWGKFRMGVEYNFIPDSTLQDINGVDRGEVANSYVGIHLGFYLGGGKWGK